MSELALDAGAPLPTADELRRIYLRAVRQRRPEVDPQGFKRVREAYELLLAGLACEMPAPPVVVEPPVPRLTPDATPVDAATVDATTVDAATADAATAEKSAKYGKLTEPQPPSEQLRQALTLAALPGSPPPPVESVLHEILSLLGSGFTQSPTQLANALQHCLAQRGDESTLLRGTLATRWLLVRELLAAAPKLPRDVIAAIARGIAAGDLEQARPALAIYSSAYAHRSPEIAEVLMRQAPNLAQVLLPTLNPQRQRAAPGPSGWRLAIAALIVLSGLGRAFTGISNTSPAEPPRVSQPKSELRDAQKLGRQHDGDVGVLARQLTQRATVDGLSVISKNSYQLADQAETHRCDTVLVLRDNILREVQRLDLPKRESYQEEYTLLDAKIMEACTELRMRADELQKWGEL